MWRRRSKNNRHHDRDSARYLNFTPIFPALEAAQFSKPFLAAGLGFLALGMWGIGDWTLSLFVGYTLIAIGRIEYRGDGNGKT